MNTQVKNTSWIDNQAQQFEVNRFGLMTIMMTVQSAWGSILAMSALMKDNYVMLAIGVAVTMAANAAFIAQSPAKWCLAIFYTSILTNGMMMFLNLFL